MNIRTQPFNSRQAVTLRSLGEGPLGPLRRGSRPSDKHAKECETEEKSRRLFGVISRVSRIALCPSAQRLLVSVPCKILCEKSKPIPTFYFIASIAKLRWS